MNDNSDYDFTDEEAEYVEDEDSEDEKEDEEFDEEDYDEDYDEDEILPNGYTRQDYYDVGFSDGDIECGAWISQELRTRIWLDLSSRTCKMEA